MPVIGAQKSTLLKQVANNPSVTPQQLAELVKKFSDLNLSDFRGYAPDDIIAVAEDLGRDPNERALWEQISSIPDNSAYEVKQKLDLLQSYIHNYPNGPKMESAKDKERFLKQRVSVMEENDDWNRIKSMPAYSEDELQRLVDAIKAFINKYQSKGQYTMKAQDKFDWANKELRKARAIKAEAQEWDQLDKNNYSRLKSYLTRYPQSAHINEIDEYMWAITKQRFSHDNIERYLTDWPHSPHADQARRAIEEMADWEKAKKTNDVFQVKDFMRANPDSVFYDEAKSLYYVLRDQAMDEMKRSPNEVTRDQVEKYINYEVFSRDDFFYENLTTDEAWNTLYIDRDLFPDMTTFQTANPNISAPDGCTDVFLFGTPGTGKTCLLMGLAGANGRGYTLNMRTQGGAYAAALQQYVNAGICPGRTYGSFVSVIHGSVQEVNKGNTHIDHPINLVEMSGEEFALRIADNPDTAAVCLEDMGTGATNLLRNDNHKVFFIIIDGTKDSVKFEYLDYILDDAGNKVDVVTRRKYISQLDILNKFVSLFSAPENQDVMSKVDAIHIIVTKSDTLGDKNNRLPAAVKLLNTNYFGPVSMLKEYCRKTKHVNYSTNYCPHVFAFSIGQFYIGDIFRFDNTETLNIVNAIRAITMGVKEDNVWDKLKKGLNTTIF